MSFDYLLAIYPSLPEILVLKESLVAFSSAELEEIAGNPSIIAKCIEGMKCGNAAAIWVLRFLSKSEGSQRALLHNIDLIDLTLHIAMGNEPDNVKSLAMLFLGDLIAKNTQLRFKLAFNTPGFDMQAFVVAQTIPSNMLQEFVLSLLRVLAVSVMVTPVALEFIMQAAFYGNQKQLLRAANFVLESFIQKNIEAFKTSPNITDFASVLGSVVNNEDQVKLAAWSLLRAFQLGSPENRVMLFNFKFGQQWFVQKAITVVASSLSSDDVVESALSTLANILCELERAKLMFKVEGLARMIIASAKAETKELKEEALRLSWGNVGLSHNGLPILKFSTLDLVQACIKVLQRDAHRIKDAAFFVLCNLATLRQVQLILGRSNALLSAAFKGANSSDCADSWIKATATGLLAQLVEAPENRTKLAQLAEAPENRTKPFGIEIYSTMVRCATTKATTQSNHEFSAQVFLGLMALGCDDDQRPATITVRERAGEDLFVKSLQSALQHLGVDVPSQQNADSLLEIFKEADAGVDLNRRLLILVTGAPEAGKTSLVNTLKNQLRPAPIPGCTIGMEFSQIKLPKTSHETPLELTVFDMAGQHEYGVLHTIFGRLRSLVLLVVDLSTFPDPATPQFEAICKERVQYYYDKTVSAARSRMCVLLVGTKMDMVSGLDVARNRLNCIYEKLMAHEADILADINAAMKRTTDKQRTTALQQMLDSRPTFWESGALGLMSTDLKGVRAHLALLVSCTSAADSGTALGFDELHNHIVQIAKTLGQRLLKRHAQLRLQINNAFKIAGGPLRSVSLEVAFCVAELAGFASSSAVASQDPRERAIQDLHDLGHLVWFREDPILCREVFDRQVLLDLAKDIVRHDLKECLGQWLKKSVDEVALERKLSLLSQVGLLEIDDVLAAIPSWQGICKTEAMQIIHLLEHFRIVVPMGKNSNMLLIPSQVMGPASSTKVPAPIAANHVTPGFSMHSVWELIGFAPPHLIEMLVASVCELDPMLSSEGHFGWKFAPNKLIGRDVRLGDDQVPISLVSLRVVNKQIRVELGGVSQREAGFGLGWVANVVKQVLRQLPTVAVATRYICDENFVRLVEWSKLEEAVRRGKPSLKLLSGQTAFVKDLYVPTMQWDMDFDFLSISPTPPLISQPAELSLRCIFASPLAHKKGNNTFVVPQLNVYQEANRVATMVRYSRNDVDVKFVWGRADKVHDALVDMGPSVVLIGAHCTPDGIELEDASGLADFVDTRTLYSAVKNAIRIQGAPRLVVINACNSAEVGRCFAAAGVPHVVAFDTDHGVHDSSALAFSGKFYDALAKGATVKDAFETARDGVRFQQERSCRGDADHYLLLPPLANHEERVWPKIPAESVVTSSSQQQVLFSGAIATSSSSNVPPLNRDYKPDVGFTWQVMMALTEHNFRFVVLRGSEESGKQELAKFVAHRILARRGEDFFSGGVVWGTAMPVDEDLSFVNETTIDVLEAALGVEVDFAKALQDRFFQIAGSFGDKETLVILDKLSPNLAKHEVFLSALRSILKYSPGVRFLLVSSEEIPNLADMTQMQFAEVILD